MGLVKGTLLKIFIDNLFGFGIEKRFVIMRRSGRRSGRYNRNNGFSIESISGTNTSTSGIWSTHFPPSYENIYNSSMPINPPPDYESAKKKTCKSPKDNNASVLKTENQNPIISYHSNQTESQISPAASPPLPPSIQANDQNLENLAVLATAIANQNIKTSNNEHANDDVAVVSIQLKSKNNSPNRVTTENVIEN